MLQNRDFTDLATARTAIERAITNYNTLRPHGSCDYHTPEQAHRMEGELTKKWRVFKRWQTEKVQQDGPTFVTQNKL